MTTTVSIALELDLTEPVSGRISVHGGEPREFSGWLELHSALERAAQPQGDRDA